tara:strand:+ start:504 stop:680 length:177 start_codon:yes stop_codon:yes gene_type:complete
MSFKSAYDMRHSEPARSRFGKGRRSEEPTQKTAYLVSCEDPSLRQLAELDDKYSVQRH